jgi:peptidylprolyl isomerase
MSQVKQGDKIRVHYTGRLEDGSEFDRSASDEPLEITVGENSVIEGFEQAVLGMTVGERKTVTIPPDQGYGPRRDEMMQEIDRSTIPEELELKLGARMEASGEETMLTLTVVEIGEKTVTLDANHPLAGKDLTFEIELLAID